MTCATRGRTAAVKVTGAKNLQRVMNSNANLFYVSLGKDNTQTGNTAIGFFEFAHFQLQQFQNHVELFFRESLETRQA